MLKLICLLIFIFLHSFLNGFAQNFVSTYSGKSSPGFHNGTLVNATYNGPFGLCIDKYDNLFIADAGNNCIRKIDAISGIVSTLAGTGVSGWKDGLASEAKFNSPADLCIDDSGNVYVSDFLNQRIRKISFDGIVSTIAGTGIAGLIDGDYSIARFNYPRGICRDKSGNLYVADSWNHRIRKIDSLGLVSTFAGGGSATGVGSIGAFIDSNDVNARFYTPAGLTIDQHGNIYVADAYNHRIRKIDTSGIVKTSAGSGKTGNGKGGYLDGLIDSAILNTPTEVFIDTTADELYIGDTFNNRIRKVNIVGGIVTTFAGNGSPSFVDSVDSLASFYYPRGIVVSNLSGKKIFVNDYSNNSIRRIEYKNILNVNENSLSKNIIVFPNPSSSIFTITFLPDQFTQITIFNLLGENIKERTIGSETSLHFDLDGYAKGIYLLKIRNSKGKFLIKKLLIE